MTYLEKILASKRDEIARAKAHTTRAQVERLAAARRDTPRGFAAALNASGVRVIAELKRASPSAGDIRPDLDPADLARRYAEGGAAALSVLTEPAFFKGSADDLRQAREAVALPVLRKDFILDPYQVYESVALNADAILLIVRIVDDDTLHALYTLVCSLGLDVLTEVFDEEDAARARALGATLVGINNRDLARFSTDTTRTARLAALFPPDVSIVALSGIRTSDDIRQTLACGIRRFLIGERLVRQPDPVATLRAWTTLHPSLLLSPMLPNLKICGITEHATARFCAEMGVGALGAVFYAKSPRYVTPSQARALFEGLPGHVARVGVFANCLPDAMLAAAREARLTTLQLHGQESLADIRSLLRSGYRVIRTLSATGDSLLKIAQEIPTEAGILVECGQGPLPGGNAAVWNWAEAAPLAAVRPFALAGGLTPDNITDALRGSRAAACDVSSGVETRPGVKNHDAIQKLVNALRKPAVTSGIQPFWLPSPNS
ncbi:MAG TPA: indole-3-glycerol phosphate synthase TrpC [Kiritimatiellia bacterium]|nr:indole-3-glycerol phosphate synthase TrpC [Kiritimatiellia bacterium]